MHILNKETLLGTGGRRSEKVFCWLQWLGGRGVAECESGAGGACIKAKNDSWLNY